MATFSVVGEIWKALEVTLQGAARKLVEDIAKQQHVDSKELWAAIRPQIKIGVLDIEVPETQEFYCSHPYGIDGAVHIRCRSPCVLGFSSCHKHIGGVSVVEPLPSACFSASMEGGATATTNLSTVDRVYDMNNHSYFIDAKGVAYDRLGMPKGYVSEENVLYLFEKGKERTTN